MENEQPAWKPTLDAITGARHGGQIEGVLDQLQALAQNYPHVAEIAYQLAWTFDSLGKEAEALPQYEKAIALGLPPNEQSGALIGLGSTLRNLGELDRAADVLESGILQFRDEYSAGNLGRSRYHRLPTRPAALRRRAGLRNYRTSRKSAGQTSPCLLSMCHSVL